MKVRLGRSAAVASVAAAFLMVLVVPVGLAAANTADLTPGPTYTLWAYGAVRTVDFSGVSFSGYDYQGTGTYGYTVILNQTNLTSDTFELAATQTMSVRLSIEYCLPNCKNPSATATVTHDAWEMVFDWANFTTDGNVSESGQNVSAIALENSHTLLVGSLLDTGRGPFRSAYLSVNVTAAANVTFATPLGLIPNDVATSPSWTSSSAFNASGIYLIGYHYIHTGPAGTFTIGPTSVSGSVQRSGTVTVAGSANTGPGGTVDFNGISFLNISLAVGGPFVAREGFILVPSVVDLFGSSSGSVWSANETGGASAQMTGLYYRPGGDAHLGIGGSEWLYSATALNPSVTSLAPSGASVDQIASGADDVGSTPVQGVPITVQQAEGYQGCLLTGAACPSAAGKPVLPLLAVGVVAVVVAALVAMVVVAERRRIPPPPYPNAKLYPPGAAGPTAPGTGPSRTSEPPRRAREEDDPLSNLW